MKKIDLKSMEINQLKQLFLDMNEKAFRGEQTFKWIHDKLVQSIDDITVLSTDLRDKLNKDCNIMSLKLLKRYDSNIDETKKYLFLLEDDNIIESVMMKYKHGISICISTQVGCRMGCSFCASTKDGLVRNLTPGEILDQFYSVQRDIGNKISNVVLMGSGEPLDNYENVKKFLEIIHNEKGQNLSYRHITLSTCGLVPKMYQLADEEIPINLSISLHSPFDEERKKIMPVANRYKISEILDACKYYIKKTNRRVTFEYTLIKDVNDKQEYANELTRLLKGMLCHVNLIPLNPIKEFKHKKSIDKSIKEFKSILEKGGVATTIRREMGSDINAACGQLRRDYISSK
ncbi:ribosomal RNA large subunit methyltransferase N [Gottschalkia purinilytica]|uniref:Probable dual-specificity RNA methyltransferase RlmN n=1 Tax=Gottschalkia purinilytica TaxID=1503 RepID=A0A0L0WB65_GOTPU|nr:23S rRNA (adenine(2503)-C(2))-methyltransferase RlmN [Gottschalkia purinilytica]KNF08743.1 ribosomal RNA large subunit methyltransferase N [Gottschalkia purinilytica]